MHAIWSYRGNSPTHTQTHPSTNRQDQLQYTAPQLASAQCNYRQISMNVIGGWIAFDSRSTVVSLPYYILDPLCGI